MVQCPSCGNQTYADLPDCQKCGKPLPSVDQAERLQRGKGSWTKMLDNFLAGFRN